MTTGYLLVGGVNVAQPPPSPPPQFGVFADFHGEGDVHWCGMRFASEGEAHRIAQRLTTPYEVRPLTD